ncbi:hypothetical protein [Candidatus Regiella insecticola]|uniref:hypothetical protein n=1 Tax=Candidatus Regiella insecticola TaxID=138073 RepID=UPI001596D54E|nr:hypothetical protein [Candidatus Regiella insecticola]
MLNKKAALLVSVLVLNSWVGVVLAGKDSSSLTVQAQLKPASCEILLDGKKIPL